MIKEEVGDEVLHALLISSHDTDFFMQKPNGIKYLIQIRKDFPKKIIKISQGKYRGERGRSSPGRVRKT